jgi:hypothetical protein
MGKAVERDHLACFKVLNKYFPRTEKYHEVTLSPRPSFQLRKCPVLNGSVDRKSSLPQQWAVVNIAMDFRIP